MKTAYLVNQNYRHRWLKLVLVLLALYTSCLNITAQPADSIRTYTEEHPLVYEDAWDLWPYVFLNEEGDPVGYNIDLLKLIFQELDIPYVIKLKPTKSALKDLKARRSDLMLGMDAHFHNEYARYGQNVIQIFTHSIVHQKNQPAVINSVEDLARHRVIVHEGSYSHHLMKQRGWGGNAIPYDDMRDAVLRAHNEPGSQILWNTMSLKWLVQTLNFDNLELTPVQVQHGDYKFMANDSRLLHQLDSVFNKLNSSGKLQAIQNKWFYPEKTGNVIPLWIWEVMGVMLVSTLLGIAYYVIFRQQEKKVTREIRRSNSRLALILKTSGVRMWMLHVASKTISRYDEKGNEIDTEVPLGKFLSIVRPDDAHHIVNELNKIAASEQDEATLDIVVKGDDGAFNRNLTVGLAVLRRNKDGRPVEIIGTSSDVTDEHARQIEVKHNMLRYQTIFNSAMVDSLTYDENGNMTDMNDKASRTFPGGKEAALACHLNLRDVLGDDLPPMDELQFTHLTRIFTTEEGSRVFSKLLRQPKMFYELQLVPIRNDEGKLLSVYETGREVTEMVHSYQKLRENAEQMQRMNEEMNKYATNVNFVLQNGGVRIVRYYPERQMLVIYIGVSQIQNQLTRARALSLTDADFKDEAQQLLDSMDSLTPTTLTASVKTALRTKDGIRLGLYFSFVPTVNADGQVTEYFGMCRDISEIMHTEEKLAEETAKAQEVEMVKSAFLRNMSFEIRTPLNSVVGFADLFSTEHSPEDESFFINEIKENSAHLLKLINDILFLSRLDAHMIEFKYQPVNFAESFEPRCQVAWYNFRHDGVDFVLDNPYQRLVVDIDEQNLGLVIDQIVANAAEHTTAGQIRVSYDYNGEALTLTFQDTGSGIPPERMNEIFERFGSTNGKGTGLGLPICHEIVQQMGGSINLKSEVGKGTCVMISVPCRCSELVKK